MLAVIVLPVFLAVKYDSSLDALIAGLARRVILPLSKFSTVAQ